MTVRQHWALTFTPENRPWLLKLQDPERGMVDEPPPAALVDYIEEHFGQFDLFPAFAPQTVRVEWLHWPPE